LALMSPCQCSIMSHVLCRLFSNTCMIALWPSVPSPVVYFVRWPPIRAVCRCDNHRRSARGSLSIIGYRLRVDRTHGSSHRSASNGGCGNIYSKTLRTGFFRLRMIMWTSAARSCRSSGCYPPPRCVASRLAPRGDSSPTWLVGCQRAPCHGVASRLSAAISNARR
jgi:hypothetical protein